MKKLLLVASFALIFTYSYSQDDLDRTGFTGEVISELIIETNEAAESEEESVVESSIIFDSKSITISGESYDIVNKEFDGIDLNTFVCSKRGSNYTISYVVDDFIAISDNSKPDLVTYYMELTE